MSDAELLNEPFGRYVLERLVARGGMAEIFLARQEGPAGFVRQLVIKRVLPELADRPKFLELFLDEARLAAQLSHPNIVAVYDFGEVDGAYFLAMELVAGPSLRDLGRAAFQAGTRLPYRITARIGAAVAEGLAHAHGLQSPVGEPLQIVHRDISPSNILVSGDGVPKIVDFGIAKATNSTHRTRTGELKGKIAYMPPEQVLGEPLDGRADVYALGVVLYQLVAGKRPFQAASEFSLMQKICAGTSLPLRSFDPEVPETLERIITRAMAGSIEHRYGDARELSADLDRFVLTQGGPVSSFDIAEQVRRVEQAFGQPLNRLGELVSIARSLPRPGPGGPYKAPTVSMRGAADEASGATPASALDRSAPTQVTSPGVDAPDRRPTVPLQAAGPAEPMPSAGAGGDGPSVLSAAPAVASRRRAVFLGATVAACAVGAMIWMLARDRGDGTVSPPALVEAGLDAASAAVVGTGADDAGAVAAVGDHGAAVDTARSPAVSEGAADAGEPDRTVHAALPRAAAAGPRQRPGRVVLETTPSVEVYKESALLGMTPLELELQPGRHRLLLKNLEQQINEGVEVRVWPGAVTRRSLDLRRARVTVLVKPWGEVYVDGQRRGTTPMPPLLLSPGAHTLDVRLPSTGRRAQRQLKLAPGEASEIRIDLSEEP